MSDFSDIDGGEEPLFAEYEDEDLADPPPLPPPLAILNNGERDPASLDNIGAGDDGGFNFGQPFDTSRNESHDQSTSAAAPTKKRKPILTFNEGRLTSPKGLHAIVNDFPKIKFKGKGHERSDLKLLINNYQEWANRLFPRLAFDDFVERAEKLGAKKEVKSVVNRLRNGTTTLGDDDVLRDEEQAPTTGATGDDQTGSDHDLPDDFDDHDDGNHHGDDDEVAIPVDTEEAIVEGDEPTNNITEPSVSTGEEEAMIDEGANTSEPLVMRSMSADCDQDDQPADCNQDDQPANCDQEDKLVDYNQVAPHCDQDDQPADCDQNDQSSECDQTDQPSECNQVNTTDHRTSSTVDKLDQALTHYDSTSSSDHEDTPTVHKATPTEHEPHDNRSVNDDTHPDITDHVMQEDHMTEDTFHNSVDKLFNDISVDELFEDV